MPRCRIKDLDLDKALFWLAISVMAAGIVVADAMWAG